ncbi:hypothetical protein LSTR_LSTR008862 [Laodelphax striatellus]|uniref:Uncharacterized protein n=1 Tax=Laodelphax striatellus TaxID=195883 RepID=A0A482WSH3_LAOST|nr:hypothetical protein LSTR_LSTR008862 [Laodelphax striatellus]
MKTSRQIVVVLAIAVMACMLVEMSSATPILPNPIHKKLGAIHGITAFKTANALLHKHRLINAKIVGVKTALITG